MANAPSDAMPLLTPTHARPRALCQELEKLPWLIFPEQRFTHKKVHTRAHTHTHLTILTPPAHQVRRLKMYNTRAKRDKKGRVISEEFQSKDLPSTRIQPDRRWFGNTRVIGQKQLEQFRTAMADKVNTCAHRARVCVYAGAIVVQPSL